MTFGAFNLKKMEHDLVYFNCMFWIKLQNNLYIAFSVSVKLLEKDKV